MAVSPQLQEFSRNLAREKRLTFLLLSDPGNHVARAFSLAYQLPEDLREIYCGFGVDLEKFNGDKSWTLPMPARFVIDQSGIIRSADVSPDHTIRAEPADTVRVLRCLATVREDMDFEACIRVPDRFGRAEAHYRDQRR